MSDDAIRVSPIGWSDMLAVTRMTFDNMIGADRYFTNMVRHPLGRWFTFASLPLYLRFSGQGFKVMVDGRMAGCGFLHLRRHSGYIYNISVSRPYRRQGLGLRLMSHLERLIAQNGQGWAVLQVDRGNEPAEQLYRQLGYQAYHPSFFRREGRPPISRATTAGVSLERLGRHSGKALYGRFQDKERQQGDFWAAAVIDEYDPWPQQGGEFWRCTLYEREIGCAQVIDRERQPIIRMALAPEYWGYLVTGGLVKELIDALSGNPTYVDLCLESSAHHRAATPVMSGLGFSERFRSRMLMLKALDGDAPNGERLKAGAS